MKNYLPSIIKYKIDKTEWEFIKNDEDLEKAYNFAKRKENKNAAQPEQQSFKLIL